GRAEVESGLRDLPAGGGRRRLTGRDRGEEGTGERGARLSAGGRAAQTTGAVEARNVLAQGAWRRDRRTGRRARRAPSQGLRRPRPRHSLSTDRQTLKSRRAGRILHRRVL